MGRNLLRASAVRQGRSRVGSQRDNLIDYRCRGARGRFADGRLPEVAVENLRAAATT